MKNIKLLLASITTLVPIASVVACGQSKGNDESKVDWGQSEDNDESKPIISLPKFTEINVTEFLDNLIVTWI